MTIEPDLDMVQVDMHVKFLVRVSNGSAVRVLTDGHTDGTDSITSTADAGGNNSSIDRVSQQSYQKLWSSIKRFRQESDYKWMLSNSLSPWCTVDKFYLVILFDVAPHTQCEFIHQCVDVFVSLLSTRGVCTLSKTAFCHHSLK